MRRTGLQVNGLRMLRLSDMDLIDSDGTFQFVKSYLMVPVGRSIENILWNEGMTFISVSQNEYTESGNQRDGVINSNIS